MFETAVEKSTDTRQKIEGLETAMLESIQMSEDFGQNGDTNGQQTCALAATMYGIAVLTLRAKMTAGELK